MLLLSSLSRKGDLCCGVVVAVCHMTSGELVAVCGLLHFETVRTDTADRGIAVANYSAL